MSCISRSITLDLNRERIMSRDRDAELRRIAAMEAASVNVVNVGNAATNGDRFAQMSLKATERFNNKAHQARRQLEKADHEALRPRGHHGRRRGGGGAYGAAGGAPPGEGGAAAGPAAPGAPAGNPNQQQAGAGRGRGGNPAPGAAPAVGAGGPPGLDRQRAARPAPAPAAPANRFAGIPVDITAPLEVPAAPEADGSAVADAGMDQANIIGFRRARSPDPPADAAAGGASGNEF